MALLLVAGENWVRQSGRSPEWWDSWVIMLWVCVRVLRARTYDLYTFAGYREYVYGASWGRMVSQGYATYVRDALPFCLFLFLGDPSVLGVIWWAGGALGIYLARNNQACYLVIDTWIHQLNITLREMSFQD